MLESIKSTSFASFYQTLILSDIRKTTQRVIYRLFEHALNDSGVLSPAQYKLLATMLEQKVVPRKNLIKQYTSITKRNIN